MGVSVANSQNNIVLRHITDTTDTSWNKQLF